jgi:protein phosphatase
MRAPAGREPRLQWDSGGATDQGRVRTINQDAFLDRPDLGLWVVADGMGGHAEGARASRALVDALGGYTHQAHMGRAAMRVCALIQEANRQLLELADALGQGVVGSTVCVMIALEGHCALLWVGDSRIYRLRGDELAQLTTDHSQVQAMVDAGLLTPEQAESHPASNVLIRAVGSDPDLEIDLGLERLRSGDRYLLCSDGLYRELPADGIAAVLGASAPAEAARSLVRQACERGGRDNVTAVVVGIAACRPGE